jgi:hypothetical protein
VGKSRGRHAAPREKGFARVVGWVAGGAGALLVVGILVSIATPWASSGSAPDPTPSAVTALFDLKGFAEGPAKPVAPVQVVAPKTVLDPDAVADPYGAPKALVTPAEPTAPVTPAPGG